jgi:pilus assembly protein CpaF
MSRLERTMEHLQRQRPLSNTGLLTVRPADLGRTGGSSRNLPPAAVVMAHLVHDLHSKFVAALSPQWAALPAEELRRAARPSLEKQVATNNPFLSPTERDRAVSWVFDEMLGFGPVQPLLDDPTVTEVLVHGGGTEIAVRRADASATTPTSYAFRDNEHVRHVLDRMTQRTLGRGLVDMGERFEFTLPDGHKVEATVPPAARPAAPMVFIRRT